MNKDIITLENSLAVNGGFKIPPRTKKLLYYTVNKPQKVGNPSSYSMSLEIKIGDFPFSEKTLREEYEKIKEKNISNEDIFKRIKERINIKYSYGKNYSEEPSIIYISLPVTKPPFCHDVLRPDYYLCYANLLPEQRWIYLDWLQDITKPVPKGYVYIYYYGLERQLLENTNIDAVDELLLLSKHHNFITKEAHKAIFLSFLHNNDNLILGKLLAALLEYPIDNLLLLLLYAKKLPLNSKLIFELISQNNIANKRYLKLHPQLYFKYLDDYFIEKYGINTYPFFNYYSLNELTLERIPVLLNYSLPSEIREVELYNIIEHSKFKTDILNIHNIIHERIKDALRKKKKK